MPSTSMPEQAKQDMPPPPYPPPFPVEIDQFNQPVVPAPARKRGMGLKKRVRKVYRSFMYKTPDIVAYFQKVWQRLQIGVKQAAANARNKYPEVSRSANANMDKLRQQGGSVSGQVTGYLLDESPLYSAFLTIGVAASVLSLILAFFVSPSAWVILLSAGLLQIGVGKYLQAKGR